jgi:hypothetical protein
LTLTYRAEQRDAHQASTPGQFPASIEMRPASSVSFATPATPCRR